MDLLDPMEGCSSYFQEEERVSLGKDSCQEDVSASEEDNWCEENGSSEEEEAKEEEEDLREVLDSESAVCLIMAASSNDLPISLRRGKRSQGPVNYREAETLKLPRASAIQSTKDKLYPVTVLEQDNDKVKVHYVGYSSTYDEWKLEDELVEEEDDEPLTPYQPYSLYNNLRMKVKQALTCGRKSSPIVRIVMNFDLVQFNGGLKTVGVPSRVTNGVQHYKIHAYQDLDPFLGCSWHYRGLNCNGDYGFVELETVDFCLRKSRPLKEYIPLKDDEEKVTCSEVSIHTGFSLSFCFVCNYGTAATFGKERKIF